MHYNQKHSSLSEILSRLPLDTKRELSDCINLGRVIRLSVSANGAQKLREVTGEIGVSYRLGKDWFKFKRDPGFSGWSSNATSCTATTIGARRFVYLHHDPKYCASAEAADRDNDECALGLILGYPVCCVKKYVAWRRENPYSDPIEITVGKAPNRLVQYNFPSPFSRYLASGLVSHFPCSMNCKYSRTQALRSLTAFNRAFPKSTKNLLAVESAFTAFRVNQGICVWLRFEKSEDSFVLSPKSARGEGQIFQYFRSRSTLRNNDADVFIKDGIFMGYCSDVNAEYLLTHQLEETRHAL